MRKLFTGLACALAAVVAIFLSRSPSAPPRAPRPLQLANTSAITPALSSKSPPPRLAAPPNSSPPPPTASVLSETAPHKLRPTAESDWNSPRSPLEPSFAKFKAWTDQFLATASQSQRQSLLPQGIDLASTRRLELLELIQSHPDLALSRAIPDSIRRELPAEIQSLLEQNVSGRGDFLVRAALPEPGRESQVEPLTRHVEINDSLYRAFPYGRRLDQSTQFAIPIHGIVLDQFMALDENPVRLLSRASLPAAQANPSDPTCGVVQTPIDNVSNAVALSTGDTVLLAHSLAHAEDLNEQLIRAESGNGTPAADGTLRPNSAYTEGTKKLILIRVDFSDLAGDPFTTSRGESLVTALNAFYRENSYGVAGFEPVGDAGSAITPTLRLPKTAATYGASDPTVVRSDARAAARAEGYDLSSYDFDLICFGSVPGFAWAGLGMVRAPGAWIRASFSTDAGVMAHELGHNFGLNHANFWETSGQSIIGAGESVEYGDSFDTMGNATAGRRHFNARYKNLLNWLPSTNVATFTTNGVYRIVAHDNPDGVGFRALRVSKNSQTNYWVELREKFTDRPAFVDGVGLRWGRTGSQATLLLDTTPGSADAKNDSPILIGRTFVDAIAGVYITPLAKTSDSPPAIDVAVYKGKFTNNLPPTLQLTAPQTNAAVNGALTFTATASDPDGDDLAYSWSFGDNSIVAANRPSVTKSWNTAGEYLVRCTVTDLRGGTSTDSILVKVGAPSTVHIAGRVTSAGKPLEGVRVYASTTQLAYTDRDGYYVITGLSRASYNVKASAEGFLFTRSGFDNPISLTANRSDINFEGTAPGNLDQVALVAAGAEWRYNDSGTDLGTTWRSPNYDDSTWDRGAAQLGYGDDNIVTTLDFGGVANAKRITYYFRRKLNVDDPAAFLSLTAGLMRDDGAVVYLNGAEWFRSNMPSGTINYRTLASASVGGSDEIAYFEFELDPSKLRPGSNTLAVEVHQQSASSSDIRFDFRLTGIRPIPILLPPALELIASSDSIQLRWPSTSDWTLTSSLTLSSAPADWTSVPDAPIVADGFKTVRLPLNAGQQFYRLEPR